MRTTPAPSPWHNSFAEGLVKELSKLEAVPVDQ